MKFQTRVGCCPKIGGQALEHWPNKHAICWLFGLGASALTTFTIGLGSEPLVCLSWTRVWLDGDGISYAYITEAHRSFIGKITWRFVRPGVWTQVMRVINVSTCQLSYHVHVNIIYQINNKRWNWLMATKQHKSAHCFEWTYHVPTRLRLLHMPESGKT